MGSEETQFKPGESGNPAGRPPEIGPVLKKMTRHEIADVYNLVMNKTKGELEEMAKDPKTTMKVAVICRAMVRDFLKGEMTNYDKLLERIIGKVPQKTAITDGEGEDLADTPIFFAPVRVQKVYVPSAGEPAAGTPPAENGS